MVLNFSFVNQMEYGCKNIMLWYKYKVQNGLSNLMVTEKTRDVESMPS